MRDMSANESCVVVLNRSGVEVSVPAGEVLLEVAEDEGVDPPSLCRGGSCGTCKVLLRSGEPSIDTLHALSEKERRAGWILACSARTVPGGRIVLEA